MWNLVRASLALGVVLLMAGPTATLAFSTDPVDPDRSIVPAPVADHVDPAASGRWLEPVDGEVPAVNMVVLHDGRVLYYSGVEAAPDDGDLDWTFFTSPPKAGESRIWDPATNTVTTPLKAAGAAGDLFCSGTVILPDGRVMAAGGSSWNTFPTTSPFVDGTRDVRIFDPLTDTWSRVADLEFARWYPSVINNPDGSALAVAGISNLTQPWTMVEALETYDEHDDAWHTHEDGDNLLPMYPRVGYLSGGPRAGDLYYNTVGTLWGPFGEHPLEAGWSVQQSYDTDDATWTTHDTSAFGVRQHAASVPLPITSDDGYAPKFLTFGGSLLRSIAATPMAELNDWSTDPPTNTIVEPMNNPRWHLNGVLLPTGEVLAVGGGLYDNVYIHGQENVPVMSAEVFDPETDTWTELAEMQVPRMYHSTASLLPDGRVVVGGHVPLPNPWPQAREEIPGTGIAANPQVAETRLEVFEPPYMFRGDRPVLQTAPEAVHYGDPITVTTAGIDLDAEFHSAVLVRPGATTHAFDATQRSIVLDEVTHDAASLTLASPPDSLVAPPGWYMLFLNKATADGPVPSEAQWIHVSAAD